MTFSKFWPQRVAQHLREFARQPKFAAIFLVTQSIKGRRNKGRLFRVLVVSHRISSRMYSRCQCCSIQQQNVTWCHRACLLLICSCALQVAEALLPHSDCLTYLAVLINSPSGRMGSRNASITFWGTVSTFTLSKNRLSNLSTRSSISRNKADPIK